MFEFPVVDATGKLESGILEGNIYWVGDYNECLKVNVPVPANVSQYKGQLLYEGKYCKASIANPNVSSSATVSLEGMVRLYLAFFSLI